MITSFYMPNLYRMYFNFLESNMPMNSFSHPSTFSLIIFYWLLPTPRRGDTEVGLVVREVVAASDV
jgi:hypothetical protein